MKIVVPVKTLYVLEVTELLEFIINHEIITVNKDGRNFVERFQFDRAVLIVVRVALKEFTKALYVEFAETIDKNDMTEQFSFGHVERTRKVLYALGSIERSIDNDILVITQGVRGHASKVVFVRHKQQVIGRFTHCNGCVINVACIDCLYANLTTGQVTRKHVLHDKEFVILHSGVKLFRNFCNEVIHAVFGEERKAQILFFGRSLVELLEVHDMERGLHVRDFTLEEFVFRDCRVILEWTRHSHEHFFNRFAKIEETFFKHRPRVRVGLRRDNDFTDTVHERGQKLILERGHVHNDCTDFTDAVCIRGHNRDIVTVIDRRGIADCI